MISRTQHVAGRAVLTTVDSLGTTDDGGRVEWALHSLATVDATARITTLEFFDEDDWDAALARFDELSAVGPRNPRVENAQTRSMEPWLVLYRSVGGAWVIERILEKDATEANVASGEWAVSAIGPGGNESLGRTVTVR